MPPPPPIDAYTYLGRGFCADGYYAGFEPSLKNPLGVPGNIGIPWDCQALCDAEPECQYVAFQVDTNICSRYTGRAAPCTNRIEVDGPGAQYTWRKNPVYDKPVQRVGYCINGLARNIALPIVYKSMRKNLIEAMQAVNATPFAVLTLEESQSASTVLHGDHEANSPERAKVEAALDWIGVASSDRIIRDTAYTHEELDSFVTSSQCLWNFRSERLFHVLLAQLVNSFKCGVMMEQIEESHGARFDYVVHVRPDVTFLREMPQLIPRFVPWPVAFWPLDRLMGSSRVGALSDWVVGGTRELMLKHWFGRVTWVNEKCTEPVKLDRVLPVGDGLRDHFKSVGVEFSVEPMPVLIVRKDKGNGDMCWWKRELWDNDEHSRSCPLNILYPPPAGLATENETGPWW